MPAGVVLDGRRAGSGAHDHRQCRSANACSRLWCRAKRSPTRCAARMKAWKAGSGTFRMNVALSKLPDFSALPGAGDHHTAGIILAPSLSYMDRAYRDCVRHGWSRAPIVEMVIPSTLDDSLAPAGAHVASLFCQHVMPQFADGSSWEQHRETVADLMIDTVEAYAPGFQGERDRAAKPLALRSATYFRPARTATFSMARSRSISFFPRGRCSDLPITACRSPAFICAAPARIPAAA